MKGEIETLLKALNAQKRTCTAVRNNPSYHPGRCAELCVGGIPVGLFGQVHPLVAANYGIDGEVYCAELNFTTLMTLLAPEGLYTPLPRFPAVERDIAVVCDDALTVAEVEACILERRRRAAENGLSVRCIPGQRHP